MLGFGVQKVIKKDIEMIISENITSIENVYYASENKDRYIKKS